MAALLIRWPSWSLGIVKTRDSPHKFHDGDRRTLVWGVACFHGRGWPISAAPAHRNERPAQSPVSRYRVRTADGFPRRIRDNSSISRLRLGRPNGSARACAVAESRAIERNDATVLRRHLDETLDEKS